MRPEFVYDARLGIHVPQFVREWDDYSRAEQEAVLQEWEEVRGRIPERVKELEREIMRKQGQLDREDHFPTSCRLNWEIAGLASVINDLHIWYRTNQDVSGRRHL